MRRLKAITALLGSVLLFGLFAAPAAAEETAELPAGLIADLTSVWTEHGVSPSTQTALLDKLVAGEVLDANLGLEPVSSTSEILVDHISQVNTFADGSISVLTTELPAAAPPAGGIGTMAINGCSVSGLEFTNCTSSGWYTGVGLSHVVSYRLHQSSYAYFISWGVPNVSCSPGLTCSAPTFSMLKQYQAGGSAAVMALSTTWSIQVIGSSGSTHHYTHLEGPQAWTS